MATRCPKCKAENPDTQSFCGNCGTQLTPVKEIPVPTQTLEVPKEELIRGTVFANRYDIIEELGTGGMGKVYRVEDTKAKEEIALKLIRPEISADKTTIDRFRNELKIARKIRHKNVCAMFDLGEENGRYYITMEYVPGEDLSSLIRKLEQLSERQTLFIAQQICNGLVEAYNLGIIHRDLKPQNIMIDKNGNARIMDFGIARLIKSKSMTGAGVMIGTPEYMSPEQVEGKELDQRSDIYSLGVLLYNMVTGKVPFEGDTPLSVAHKHRYETAQNPKSLNPQISEGLNNLIIKCMEKNPEKRYETPQRLIGDLQNILKGVSHIEEFPMAADSSRDESNQQAKKEIQISSRATVGKELAKIIEYSKLLIKNDIIHATFDRSESVVLAINEITSKLLWDSDEIFFVNQGGGEITCIFDREKDELFHKILSRAKEVREKVAVIRIQEPKGKQFSPGINVPGLYAFFIHEVSQMGVNLLDILSTGSQLTLVLAEEDLIKAYSALSDSIKYFRSTANVQKL
jgi:serine/threonine protein kinase